MQFLQAFPIAIIDEDFEGQTAAGRGMRRLAKAIEGEGIFKSNNFGVSWFLLASTAANLDFQVVNRIAVGPTTASHHTAGTS